MEILVLIALVIVVIAKAFTGNRLSALESQIRAAQQEEADVAQRLQSTESALRQLEKEQGALEQEIKHLENDKDLASLEVTKAGGNPLTEAQLDQLLEAKQAKEKAAKAQEKNAEQDEDAVGDTEESSSKTEDSAETPPNDQTTAEQPPKDKYRILVVDDNNELRTLLQQALESEYQVIEAPDGYEALSKVIKEKQEYDLIITDLKMPNVNGITLVEHLPDNIPTIVISAFVNNPEFKEALKKVQPTEILEKPFQMSKLRQAIKNLLPS